MMYIVEGNVGKSELRYTPTGKAVLNFTVAQSNDWYNRETQKWVEKAPTWLSFTLWEEQAERGAQWIAAGKKVQVSFKRLTLENWVSKKDGKTGTTLAGNNVTQTVEIVRRGRNQGGEPQESNDSTRSNGDTDAADPIEDEIT
jgi:single stranded DNA-binding protein